MRHPLRRIVLFAAAVVIIVVSAIAVHFHGFNWTPATAGVDTPEACITRLLSAEQLGDPIAYLDCFSAVSREVVESNWQGQPADKIRRDLRNRSSGLLGRVLKDIQFENPDSAELILERIYQDCTERQTVNLSRQKGRWLILSISHAERLSPAIPYGTPVFAGHSAE